MTSGKGLSLSDFQLRVASPCRGKSSYCIGQELAGLMSPQLPESVTPSRSNPRERLGLGEGQELLRSVGGWWSHGTEVLNWRGVTKAGGRAWVCEPQMSLSARRQWEPWEVL